MKETQGKAKTVRVVPDLVRRSGLYRWLAERIWDPDDLLRDAEP